MNEASRDDFFTPMSRFRAIFCTCPLLTQNFGEMDRFEVLFGISPQISPQIYDSFLGKWTGL